MRLAVAAVALAGLAASALGHDMEWDEEGRGYIVQRRQAAGAQLEHSAEVGRRLDEYMGGMHGVIGWFDLQALLVLRVLSAHQITTGVKGGVVEIGVHHGKSLAALCLLNQDGGGGKVVAVDVFEDQVRNTDASGEGDQALMMHTLSEWCGEDSALPARLTVLEADSRTLSPSALIEAGGGAARLFSIDGSHTAAATLHDLRLAAGTVGEGGVVMVDDYFAEGWPGVSEGVQTFLREQDASSDLELIPFFVGFNKVLLAPREHASGYMETLLEARDVVGDQTMRVKMSVMAEHPVVIFTEEVRCRKNVRGLLPGEACPEGFNCGRNEEL